MKYPQIVLLLVSASTLPLAAQSAGAGGVKRLDAALDKLIPPGAAAEMVIGSLQFAEGPVWPHGSGYLLFSDLPNNAIMKWTPAGGLSVFRKPVFRRGPAEALAASTA